MAPQGRGHPKLPSPTQDPLCFHPRLPPLPQMVPYGITPIWLPPPRGLRPSPRLREPWLALPFRQHLKHRVRVRVGVRLRLGEGGRDQFQPLGLRLRLRLGGGVVGSVLVDTPDSVHITCIELQLLIIPQHRIHIPPRTLLFRPCKPTKSSLRGA